MAQLQNNDLINAAKNLDANKVEYCIKQGLDPNALDKFGKPPLFHVITAGHGKNSHTPEFARVRETIHVLLFYGARLDNLSKKEKSILDDFMRGYKGKQSIIKPSQHNPEEKVVFDELKQELLKQKDFLLRELPIGKAKSFLDKHLESILISLIGFYLPIYIRNTKGTDLYAGNEFWSKLSLVIALPILAFSFFMLIDFWKEKKLFKLLLTLPPLFSSILFVFYLFSLQEPQVRYARVIKEYRECFDTNQSICNPIQKGIYEDFLFSKGGKYLRKDKSVLFALAEGIRPHSIWTKWDYSEQEEFARRGFVYYISELENGKSVEEIFSDYNGSKTFYAIAFAEANPNLLTIDSIPEEIKSRLPLEASEKFPIGILNDDRINSFYKSILLDVNSLSREETQLALYFLTQFQVDLDESKFSILLEHWISFHRQFEKELRHILYTRNQIRLQMLSAKKDDSPVGVKFLEESDFEFYKPFLMSAGVAFTKGDDISLTFHLEVEDTHPVKPMNRVIFPEVPLLENEVPIYVLVTDRIHPELKETDQTLGEQTWIYALPASLVCKTCK